MKKALRMFSSIILALLFLACIGINAWYVYILYFGPDKVVSDTFEVGLQTLEDGNTKYFAEVLLHRNSNNDGLHTFEIKYNYLVDENRNMFYSQGQQFTTTDGSLFDYSLTDLTTKTTEPGWYSAVKENEYKNKFVVNSNAEYYNYSSSDDYKTTLISSNPIGKDTRFKIMLADEIYFMTFKNEYKEIDRKGPYYEFNLVYGFNYYNVYYSYIDNLYFANILYNSLGALDSGTSQAVLFEFGDLFKKTFLLPDCLI